MYMTTDTIAISETQKAVLEAIRMGRRLASMRTLREGKMTDFGADLTNHELPYSTVGNPRVKTVNIRTVGVLLQKGLIKETGTQVVSDGTYEYHPYKVWRVDYELAESSSENAPSTNSSS
jgi:hypothetical protein